MKILQIRELTSSKCDGIDSNCQGLLELFRDDEDIQMLPIINYTIHTDPIFHKHWLDRNEICESIVKYGADIIHIQGASTFTLPVAISCAKRFKLPIVLSPHFHPFYALKSPFLGKMYFNVITKRALKDVDLVFTINKEDSSFFIKYHSNVVTAPHWSRFEPSDSIMKNPKMILIVGRIDESNKGFEHLFHLPEGKYEIHCVGRGDVPMRSDMTHHLNISDEELKQLYMKSSLLVVPSRYEAFSYVSIEALMCNTPIVISDRVRIGDYLEGMDGVGVFKYQDYEDFNLKVDQIIGKSVDTEKVCEIFNPERIKQIYKNAYRQVYAKYKK